MGIIRAIQSLLSRTPPPLPAADAEDQEAIFRARYENFQRLLAANNASLDLMAALEAALHGERHFGMYFLRSTVTALLTKVYSMVERLRALAPERYPDLPPAFHAVAEEIRTRLAPRKVVGTSALVLDLHELSAAMADDVGAKMAHLGELRRLSIPVPDGFAITAAACQTFFRHNGLGEEIACMVQSHAMGGALFDVEATSETPAFSILDICTRIQAKILDAPVPEEVQQAIFDGYARLKARLGYAPRVALRSSAVGEDAAGASFAGQHRSLLNLTEESLLDAYKEILASKYSPHATVYRHRKGIREDEVFMAVGCLVMVDAAAGGVAYSRSPVDPHNTHVHITAALGAAKGVVDGSAPTDQYQVTREDPPRLAVRDIAEKSWRIVQAATEGVRREAVEESARTRPCLTDSQAIELARMVLFLEDHYGTAQDVEWVLTPTNELVVLQARPLEIRAEATQPDTVAPAAITTPARICGGQTVSPGAGCGPVHILRNNVDMLTVPQGAVLVCADALPKWAAVLPQASAVVSERGSTAGHLGTVAREFRIPALFGVPEATALLAPGEIVTVDASTTCIYPGRVEALLAQKPAPPPLAGSPVYQTLERLAEVILPLTLTDPDSPRFRAKNCTTLHDITRFCHEKAVTEMFAFGRDHPFSPRASKQLKTVVPMQWWVLNLDDGFTREVTGRYVDLASIASIPMLALWRGIVAFPWEGPPSLDGRGFMSVLFQSATNPNLEPGAASQYATKNYFVIARHFCSMQCRFGYHFTSVETMAGPRPRENYIRFQFKGGAADETRRARRARLVAELLDAFHFQTQVRGDNLAARMDDCDAAFIEKHLELLGHLIMHTRQLDMIMAQEDLVAAYRERLLSQMRWLYEQPLPTPVSSA
jgi:pyruvate,water dikinase